MVTKMVQLGPGMYSQSSGPCDDCRGKGEVIDEKHKCKTCNGKKVCKEKKIIEAEVDKGSPDGYNYVFHGDIERLTSSLAPSPVMLSLLSKKCLTRFSNVRELTCSLRRTFPYLKLLPELTLS